MKKINKAIDESKAENIDIGKKIMLKLARIVVYILYGIWLSDPQNGFRVMSKKAAKKINITANTMEHAGEIYHEIRIKNLKYKEVPVHIRYTDYSKAKGKFLILHGTADTYITMDQFAKLANELEEKGVPHEMITYGGAPHAFTVFGSSRYREDADKKSWKRFTEFLEATIQ